MTKSELELSLALHIREAGLPEPIHDKFYFHPVRRWRADFAWPDRMLLVEVEGGTWTGGRHTRGDGYDQDCIKYNEAVLLGFRILRFTARMVADGTAIMYLEAAMK